MRTVYKNCDSIQKLKKISDLSYIHKNQWNKFCFTHDVAYADSKDFVNRTVSDKVLRDWAYEISLNLKTDGYQRGLASIVYRFLDKETESAVGADVNEIHKKYTNQWLKKFKRRRVYARFKDNILVADSVEMGSLSLLFWGGLIFSPNMPALNCWQMKKSKTFLNGFITILYDSKNKRNKFWDDQGKELYYMLM